MNSSFVSISYLLLFALAACQPSSHSETKSPEGIQVSAMKEDLNRAATPKTQLLVVTTPAWDQFNGKLQRFEGDSTNWQAVGGSIPIVVGKNGLGWAVQETELQAFGGPIKKEGDLKSPAGVFQLGTAFGYAATPDADWINYPYWPITAQTMCIEDVSSEYYNQILEEGEVPADWNSTDHMRRTDDLYEWGVFVEHNFPEPTPKGGSCIFLHVWNTKGGKKAGGTAGCTAMDKAKLVEVLRWLDEEKSQMMIQMPLEDYQKIQAARSWPSIN
ncbi:MAG: L,D-transpeptidase family protein [Bacteroidota bacterium]